MPRTLPASLAINSGLTGISNIVCVLSYEPQVLVSKLARRSPKVMEIAPKDVDLSPKDQPQMTDADTAFHLIDQTFVGASGRDVKEALSAAYQALKRREDNLPKDVLRDRQRFWTGRRVRALWNREARRVDYYEIQDLTAVAVEEARIERQRLKARDDRMATFLAAHEAGEDGEGGRVPGWASQRLDRSRIGTTDADESADQSHWGR